MNIDDVAKTCKVDIHYCFKFIEFHVQLSSSLVCSSNQLILLRNKLGCDEQPKMITYVVIDGERVHRVYACASKSEKKDLKGDNSD